MELELKITCSCHQAKFAICCQMPLVAPVSHKICTGGFFNLLNQICSLTSPAIQVLKQNQLRFSGHSLDHSDNEHNKLWQFMQECIVLNTSISFVAQRHHS